MLLVKKDKKVHIESVKMRRGEVEVNNIACVRVKRAKSECFRIDSGVRQGCIVPPWLFSVYMDEWG